MTPVVTDAGTPIPPPVQMDGGATPPLVMPALDAQLPPSVDSSTPSPATDISTATLLGFITGDPGTKQYQRLYTAWFRCFLADDSAACTMFKGGADCPICKEPGWAEIFAKNF